MSIWESFKIFVNLQMQWYFQMSHEVLAGKPVSLLPLKWNNAFWDVSEHTTGIP